MLPCRKGGSGARLSLSSRAWFRAGRAVHTLHGRPGLFSAVRSCDLHLRGVSARHTCAPHLRATPARRIGAAHLFVVPARDSCVKLLRGRSPTVFQPYGWTGDRLEGPVSLRARRSLHGCPRTAPTSTRRSPRVRHVEGLEAGVRTRVTTVREVVAEPGRDGRTCRGRALRDARRPRGGLVEREPFGLEWGTSHLEAQLVIHGARNPDLQPGSAPR